MYDDDRDVLAAEYVLGTLSADEREQAEALLSVDPGFEAAVRAWERRLGELNVMVEAVEPPVEVWDKIKLEVSAIASETDAELPAVEQTAPQSAETSEQVVSSAAPASAGESEPGSETAAEPAALAAEPILASAPPTRIERSVDVVYLARRVKRWRRMTLLFGGLAAVLAAYTVVSQMASDLIPLQWRRQSSDVLRRLSPPQPLPTRLVAVLQQEPTAPAFLLTLDAQGGVLTARRVSAMPEAGRSYELWLVSKRLATPRSLGIVGNDEFIQRKLPADCDADMLRGATYVVSLELAGGSKSGAPTGPVLFTGKAVDSLPVPPPR